MSLTRPSRAPHRVSVGGAPCRPRWPLHVALFACSVLLAVACIEPVAVGTGGDTAPPSISDGQPSGSLPAGTTEATMRVTTDEAATCRWGTSSTLAYAALPNEFATTGETSHSTGLSGLSDGGQYEYHVRCRDETGNANDTSYLISFGVIDPADSTPPVIGNARPSGTLPAGTTQTTMSVTTNESATCRWSASEADAFADMPNVFATTGNVAHSTPLTGLSDGQSYTHWVRCQDLLGNANTSSHAVSFSVASGPDITAPVISNPLPSGTLPAGTRQVSIRVTTNEPATCRFGSVDAAYAQLPTTFSTTGGTSHVSLLVGFSDGQTYTFYVRCQDPTGNTNTSSTVIRFSIAAA